MRAIPVAAVVALLLGVASAQDDCCKDQCPMVGIICPGEKVCTEKSACRELCTRMGEYLAAVRKECGVQMKAKYNMECPHTCGTCTAEGCDSCGSIKKDIVAPVLKEKVTAHMKGADKNAVHKVDGKDVKCTFLKKGDKGDSCASCVKESANQVLKKLEELISGKK